MSTVPKGSKFSNQTVYILLGAAAFVVLACAGIFMVMIYNLVVSPSDAAAPTRKRPSGSSSKVEASQLTAEQVLKVFLDEIKENKLEDAYQRTSENFQGRMSQGQFEQYIHENLKGLFGHTTRRLTSTGQTSQQVRRWEGHAGGGPHPGCSFTIEISYEPEGWRVNQFLAKK